MSTEVLAPTPHALNVPSLGPLREAAVRLGGLARMALTAAVVGTLGFALAVLFSVGAVIVGVVALAAVAVLAVLFVVAGVVAAALLVVLAALGVLLAIGSSSVSLLLRIAAFVRGQVRTSAVELGVASEDAVFVERDPSR